MIVNQTKNKLLSRKEKICNSFLSQAIGLMFRHRQNLVMVFPEERKISLHNCFVFYSIDVLIVDAQMKIVEIKRNFKPFGFWNASQKGKYVIELAFPGEYGVGDHLLFC
ncbi:DUF192 domain-containing protein [Candidatus Woesearchaeota archaeon]|nr:DUF192 domain-containing protein [Candidatus Woesearchaeota archaeon]